MSRSLLSVSTSKLLCASLLILGAAVPAMAQSASQITTDTTTSGNWKGIYGVDGYIIANDSTLPPSYATVTTTGTAYTWYASTTDTRALLKGLSLTDRIASTYYNATGNSFTIDLNITDGGTHQVSLYALDLDLQGRVQTIAITNASTNAPLNSVTASNFGGGVYYTSNISGHVKITVTATGPGSAVVSGIFLGGGTPTTVNITSPQPGNVTGTLTLTAAATAAVGVTSVQFKLDGANIATPATGTGPNYSTSWNSTTAPSNGAHTLTATATDALGRMTTSAGVAITISGAGPPTPTATYVRTDTPTSNQGNWKASYGQDGFVIPNEPNNSIPSYATYSAIGTGGIAPLVYAYLDSAGDTTDLRAMQWATSAPATLSNGVNTVSNPARNPSVAYDNNTVTVDVNFTDGNSHQVAIYALDFDSVIRAETINMLDGNTNTVLSSQTISNFHNGQYLIWTLKGHVKIQFVNNNSATSLVYSGIFFGGGIAAPAVTMTAPTAGGVAGVVTVSATATSGAGIASVQFQLDGVNLGAAQTASPYSVQWNTTTAISGSHALTAIATDTLGQSTTSAGITVSVNNPVPSVLITSPGAVTVLGTIAVQATASSTNNTVVAVQFKLDGAALGSPVTSAPYSVQWNTNSVANGAHVLTAIATDNIGQFNTSAPVNVTVSNGGPTVTMTSPANGATPTGTITVSATAVQTNAPVASVQFLIDGANLGAPVLGATGPYSVQFDTTTVASGPHVLKAIGTDTLGQSTTSGGVTVTITNPPPTVSITAPLGGTVTGTTTISATAASAGHVASVQFKLDTGLLGPAITASPYNYQWATTGATNGAHTLYAVATDNLGQKTTSTGISVTVSNPPPTVSITGPTGTVSGTQTVTATASSTIGLASVQFKLDTANLGALQLGAGPNFSVQWSTGTATNGPHNLTATATDTQGQQTTSSIATVTVSNTPPTVSITAPTATQTVAGTTNVTANATSTTATIANVQFKLDGQNLGLPVTGAGPLYTLPWSTGTATNGAHVLSAVATDTLGIFTQSANVSVTVSNPPPTVNITSPTGAFSLVGTVNVTASASSSIGLASVQFQLDGANLGAAVTGSGPSFTAPWVTSTATNGSHTLTAIATDAQNQQTTSNPVTVNVSNGPPPAPSASFVKTDLVTQGNWKSAAGNVYGKDGYIIANDSNNPAPYATITSTGSTPYTWLPSSTDPRALLKGSSLTDRIASTFYTQTNFLYDMNFIDGQVHQIAVYCLDLEGSGRSQTVSILNANTNAVLNSQTLSNFSNGVYAIWNVQGHIQIKVQYVAGLNAVVSGFFFDTSTPPPPPPVVTMTSPAAGPVSGTVSVGASATSSAGIASVQFLLDGANLGAAITGSGPYSYSWNSTTVVNGTHTLSAIATDTVGQTTTSSAIIVTSSNTVTAPTVTITAPSAGTVSGPVTVTASTTSNAGISSVQFLLDGANLGPLQTGSGPSFSYQWNSIAATNGSHTLGAIATDALHQTGTASTVAVTVLNTAPSATFVKLDTATQGTWKGTYGADGYLIANDSNVPPSYATLTPPGAGGPPYTWVPSTSDVRALQKGASATDRIASTYYTLNTSSFTFDVNITDAQTHQLALYALDLENSGRAETITILNANTNAVLATQAISNFPNGVWVIFNVTSHVQVQVTLTGGPNAVLSGLFFKTNTPPPPAPTVTVTTPAPGAPISGTVALTATASANSPATLASVQFQVDGANVGPALTASPFTTQWNSTTYSNGSHSITAIATDSLGQATTSTAVSVTTTNTILPPAVTITAPVAGLVSGTVTVTATATATAGIAQVQFQLDGANLGAAVTGTGPTYSTTWNTTTTTGAHILTAIATDKQTVPQSTTSAQVSVTVSNTGPTATFVKLDTATQGNWKNVYGKDGYVIPNDSNVPPTYATISGPGAAGPAYTWVPSTTDTRALLKGASTTDRIASTYYSSTNFTIDINNTDANTHQLALYVWDLENSGRTETIQILNGNTSAVLVTEPMTAFSNGVYAVFNITGHVQVKVTFNGGGLNAVLCGLFLSTNTPPPPAPTVSVTAPLTGVQTGTVTFSATAAASSPATMASVQFQVDGANLGAPITGAGPYSTQWNTTTFTNASHSLTAIATDSLGQSTTSTAVSITTSNTVLPPAVSITAPTAGLVSGTVTVSATATATAGIAQVQFQLDGVNLGAAVTGTGPTYSTQWNTTTATAGAHILTAIATDKQTTPQSTTSGQVSVTVSNTGPTATFVKLDTTTIGNWKGTYGTDGYIIPNDSNVPPSYATISGPGAAGPAYTWVASTTDPRALLKGASSTDRIASTYYSSTNFTIDVNNTDANTHQLALYLWDLENSGRTESIQIINANTSAVLVTQPMSNFNGGVYAVFNVTGHIQVKVIFNGGGLNAVLCGLFFKTNTPPPPAPTVGITTPANNSPQSGSISVIANATASSPATMASVQFQLDGVNLGALQTGAGPTYNVSWNTTTVTNGSHILTAIATDSLGQSTTSTAVTVTTTNTQSPPVVGITVPTAGVVSGTVTVTASATAPAGMASVQFQLDGANLGSIVLGTGPTFTTSWNTTTTTGAHILTAIAKDAIGQTTTSAQVSVTVSNTGPAATFVSLDSNTKGNWKGVYGADGYIIPNDSNVPPSYATITGPGAAGPAYTWVPSTTDTRALLKGASATDRIASTYYSSTGFTIDINNTDANSHQLALYLWDLENSGRTETLTIFNPATSTMLATKSMSAFGNGVYAVFNVTGHVQLNVTFNGSGLNAVLCGLFFATNAPPPPAPSVSITTPVNGSPQSGSITVSATASANLPATMASVQFQVDGANLGAAITGAGPYSTSWNTANLTNGSHSLTAIATDSLGQFTTSTAVNVTTNNVAAPPVVNITAPAAGNVSGIVTVTANATATAGISYVQFQLDGINLGAAVTGTGPNYSTQWNTANSTPGAHVLRAIAHDTGTQSTTSTTVNVNVVVNSGPSATFIKFDTTTLGSWVGVYGQDGYIIPNDANTAPTYATVALNGTPAYTWFASTTDPRALLQSPTTTARIASTYYANTTSFSIGLNLTDGQLHQIALYALDFDTHTRNEVINILDATTNNVLATAPLTSFNGGIYAVFNISGNVIIQVNNAIGGQPNILLNGIFFRSFTGLQAPAVAITNPTGGTVSGPVAIAASATSAQGIASVQFMIDGAALGSVQTGSAPYTTNWASPLVANGVHQISVMATDTLGLTATSAPVSVTVSNGAPATPSALFLNADITTSGNWVGHYGSDGYMLADGGASPGPDATLPTVISYPPFYAQVNLDGALQWTWHAAFPDQGDAAALAISPTSPITIGAAYYQTFTYPQGGLPLLIDVNFADNLPHQMSLYFVDWHHNVRTQTITIVNPTTQAVLNTQTITNFSGGTYLTYKMQGHVQIQVTLIVTSTNLNNNSTADSVVMAAMFFDPAH